MVEVDEGQVYAREQGWSRPYPQGNAMGDLPKGCWTCQFCGRKPPSSELTIDHLVPLAHGGLDEMTNYVTCCKPCNERKDSLPLQEFAESVAIEIEDLPVHGDPVIDNEALPIQIRLLRKRVFDSYRH